MSVAATNLPYPYIVRDAAILAGQPVVEGTRIPVTTLVRAHQLGMDFDEILVQYPSLTPAQLHAAFLFYLDHQDEIDALQREAESPPPAADVARG